MKIRTDFVTNSSTSNYGEVVIDNLVLLEILARYKALGTFFDEYPEFNIGGNEPVDDKGYKTELDPDIKTLTPAFHLCIGEDNASFDSEETPISLDGFLEKFIELILVEVDRESEFADKLEKELRQKEEEIKGAFNTIKWYMRNERYDGRYEYWQFKYDQENGESYHEDCTGNMDF